jgi:DNA-binding transcriptional regulator YdaS (Cro superfamily)
MDLPDYLRTFPSQADAARAFAVTQGTISHWMTGRRRPSPNKAQEIMAQSGGKVKFADIYGPRSQ